MSWMTRKVVNYVHHIRTRETKFNFERENLSHIFARWRFTFYMLFFASITVSLLRGRWYLAVPLSAALVYLFKISRPWVAVWKVENQQWKKLRKEQKALERANRKGWF